ncbi:ribosomal-protein-L7/L12-serine acetyltransferase [Candidatus Rubidus massiliensis]|nr:ribosomal-protein-L7/L12-serine acetyltransferase [Candidatus Rubidus massiliensis]
MLIGKNVQLKWVRQKDLEELYERHANLSNRGDYFPLTVTSESLFKKQFSETGFWSDTYGRLLIVNPIEKIVGSIWYFQSISYFDALEIGYIVWDEPDRSKGYMSESLQLFSQYIFDSKKINRLEIRLFEENLASRKVAEKCGYSFEGIARGAFFHKGKNVDLYQYAKLRTD